MSTREQMLQRRMDLFAELAQEQDAFLRGVGRQSYQIDGEPVDRDGWRTITTDRYNQLTLALQMEGEPVELEVPPGSI